MKYCCSSSDTRKKNSYNFFKKPLAFLIKYAILITVIIIDFNYLLLHIKNDNYGYNGNIERGTAYE